MRCNGFDEYQSSPGPTKRVSTNVKAVSEALKRCSHTYRVTGGPDQNMSTTLILSVKLNSSYSRMEYVLEAQMVGRGKATLQ